MDALKKRQDFKRLYKIVDIKKIVVLTKNIRKQREDKLLVILNVNEIDGKCKEVIENTIEIQERMIEKGTNKETLIFNIRFALTFIN